jgi:predicted N-acetyltransferase YhbS
MSIELIPEWQLTNEDDAAIAALLARCFDTDFGGRSYFKQRHHFRLVRREAGHIIGHMAVCFRAVRLGGNLIDIAGLAEVSCDPDHRGAGIATDLLHRAIAEAKANSAQFFLLFGTAGLYGAAGFQPAHNPTTYVDLHGARTGAVKSEPAETLRVLALRGNAWDVAAPLDLLGTLF